MFKHSVRSSDTQKQNANLVLYYWKQKPKLKPLTTAQLLRNTSKNNNMQNWETNDISSNVVHKYDREQTFQKKSYLTGI